MIEPRKSTWPSKLRLSAGSPLAWTLFFVFLFLVLGTVAALRALHDSRGDGTGEIPGEIISAVVSTAIIEVALVGALYLVLLPSVLRARILAKRLPAAIVVNAWGNADLDTAIEKFSMVGPWKWQVFVPSTQFSLVADAAGLGFWRRWRRPLNVLSLPWDRVGGVRVGQWNDRGIIRPALEIDALLDGETIALLIAVNGSGFAGCFPPQPDELDNLAARIAAQNPAKGRMPA